MALRSIRFVRLTVNELFGDDAGAGRLHLEDLDRAVDALGRMVEDQSRVCDMRVDEFVLPAAIVHIAVVDLTIFIDVIVQR